MIEITKEQLKKIKGWNDRRVQAAVERGEIRDNGKKYAERRFLVEESLMDSMKPYLEADLREEHLRIKIAKEKQMLILERLDLLELFADTMQTEFFFPLIAQLTDIVRQHTSDEGIRKWNETATVLSKEKFAELLKDLERQVMD